MPAGPREVITAGAPWPPSRTTGVIVAGLLRPHALIEISAVAVLGG